MLASVRSRKGTEVLRALKIFCRLLHGLLLERIREVKHVPAKPGRADSPAENSVAVSFRAGVVARMKIFSRFLNRENPDAARQMVVQSLHQVGAGNSRGQPHVRRLLFGMHARIGPPGSIYGNLLPADLLQSGDQQALNGDLPGLDLPSAEICPVVGQLHQKVAPCVFEFLWVFLRVLLWIFLGVFRCTAHDVWPVRCKAKAGVVPAVPCAVQEAFHCNRTSLATPAKKAQRISGMSIR